MKMIEVQTVSNNEKETFQSYDNLFEYIVEAENLKMLELEPDFRSMQWSFTAYSPRHVQALYTHLKDQHLAVRQASENQLPLIEICSGDFTNPEYVVGTEDTKIRYLKKKWTLAYCASHGMTIAAKD
jgi:hypothetical protein